MTKRRNYDHINHADIRRLWYAVAKARKRVGDKEGAERARQNARNTLTVEEAHKYGYGGYWR